MLYQHHESIKLIGLDDINPEKADWHSINDGRQDGFFDFEGTLCPYENVVAYALVDLVSETEQDANLRIGSDDGWLGLLLSRHGFLWKSSSGGKVCCSPDNSSRCSMIVSITSPAPQFDKAPGFISA